MGVTEALVQNIKSVTNNHKQLQNVCVSVLLIKALSLSFNKLQVLLKTKRCQLIHLNSFIQNEQWITVKSLQLRGVGRTALMS
jgi:hypothetical protein